MIINGKEVEVIVTENKRYYGYKLRFKMPNILYVEMGKNSLSLEEIIAKHKRFINNILNYVKPDESNVIHYLGKEYKINVIESLFDNLIFNEDEINIYSKKLDKIHIKKIIYDMYERTLRDIVLKYDSKVKRDFKINFDVTYKYSIVKTYFGECYPKRRLIILNKALAKYDLIYILSVIYHEYAHFYYSNHQKGFYKLLDSLFPDYQNIQKNLRKIKYLDLY